MLLLLLAFLGATPRQYLHNLFADHVDADYGFRGKECALAPTVYHCGFHHQVATSPGVPETIACLEVLQPVVLPAVVVSLHTAPLTGYGILADGRGPPATVACVM